MGFDCTGYIRKINTRLVSRVYSRFTIKRTAKRVPSYSETPQDSNPNVINCSGINTHSDVCGVDYGSPIIASVNSFDAYAFTL